MATVIGSGKIGRKANVVEAKAIEATAAAAAELIAPTPKRREKKGNKAALDALLKRCKANDVRLQEQASTFNEFVEATTDCVDSLIAEASAEHTSDALLAALKTAANAERTTAWDSFRLNAAFADAYIRSRIVEAKAKTAKADLAKAKTEAQIAASAELGIDGGNGGAIAGAYAQSHAVLRRFDWLQEIASKSKRKFPSFVRSVLAPFARYNAETTTHEIVNPTRSTADSEPGARSRLLTAEEEKSLRGIVVDFASGKLNADEVAKALIAAGLRNKRAKGKKAKPQTEKQTGSDAPKAVAFGPLGNNATTEQAIEFVKAFVTAKSRSLISVEALSKALTEAQRATFR